MNPENPKPVFHSREQNENTRLQEDLRQHQAELEMQNEELRKSQENIEKVQQAYRDLYENAPVGYITLDQKGAIVRANLTFYRIICTPGSNCRNSHFALFLSKSSLPQYIDFLHQLKQDEGKKECEVELAGEEPKVARLVGESVTSPDGKTEFRLALIDTTATHIARRELQESQNFLESILNNAPLFILILDTSGIIEFANETWIKFLESLDNDQVLQPLGRHYSPFLKSISIHKDLNESMPWDENLAQLYAGRKNFVTFELATASDMGMRFHEVLLRRFCTENKSRIIAAHIDVTERKSAEKERARQARDNESVARLSRDLIESRDFQAISDVVLEEALAMTDSPIGFTGYIDPETGHLICPTLAAGHVHAQCAMTDREVVFKEFNGLWGWVLKNRHSLLSNKAIGHPEAQGVPEGHIAIDRFLAAPALIGGEIVGEIAVANSKRDYNDNDRAYLQRIASVFALAIQRTRSEKQLEEARKSAEDANRAKTRFLSVISHELRTPLNSVLGFAELLQHPSIGDLNATQQEHLGHIEKSGKHLLDLINDLLDLARIEAGGIHFHPETCNLSDLIRHAIGIMASQAQIKDLHITFDSAETQTIYADSRKTLQILLNLLSNAVKYTPEGGSIRIETGRSAGTHALVSIHDSGIGIPPEQLQNIFNEFYQADRQRDERLGGVGIGLALTRRLVENQGGHIEVESTENQGACFRFTLPLAPETKKTAHPSPTEATAIISEKINDALPDKAMILVAEDRMENQILIQAMLETMDCQCTLASNGRECLELAPKLRPDMILMDVQMPEMNGIEATKRLRNLTPPAKCPIIALTADAETQTKNDCLEAGCDGILIKPLSTSALFECLKRFL